MLFLSSKTMFLHPSINIHQRVKLEPSSLWACVSVCLVCVVFYFKKQPFLCTRGPFMCVCVQKAPVGMNYLEESLFYLSTVDWPQARTVLLPDDTRDYPNSPSTLLRYDPISPSNPTPNFSQHALMVYCRCPLITAVLLGRWGPQNLVWEGKTERDTRGKNKGFYFIHEVFQKLRKKRCQTSEACNRIIICFSISLITKNNQKAWNEILQMHMLRQVRHSGVLLSRSWMLTVGVNSEESCKIFIHVAGLIMYYPSI